MPCPVSVCSSWAKTRSRGSLVRRGPRIVSSHGKHHSSDRGRPPGTGLAATMRRVISMFPCLLFATRDRARPASARPGNDAPRSPQSASGPVPRRRPTVISVPVQPRIANWSSIPGVSERMPTRFQKSMQRAKASRGGHDTSNTVIGRKANRALINLPERGIAEESGRPSARPAASANPATASSLHRVVASG